MNKNKIAFIVDSSLGLFEPDLQYDNVRQVYFNIIDSDENDYLDNNVELTIDKIFEKFKENKSFKTSAVSPGRVIVLLEELLENYEKVILLTVSSGLSSFYVNIKFLEEEYKDKFFVVDTKEIGYGIRHLFEKSLEMANNGASVNEIISFCEEGYKKNFTAFTCESWEPLSKSGRAPKLLSKVLSSIHTRPVMNFFIKIRLGGAVFGKSDKGFYKAFDKMIELAEKTFKDISLNNIEYIVFYNNRIKKSRADFVRNKLVEIFKVTKEKIIETLTPNLVLVYTGMESFGIHIKFKAESEDRE